MFVAVSYIKLILLSVNFFVQASLGVEAAVAASAL